MEEPIHEVNKISVMAAARSQRSDTLQHLCRLSDEHEILLLKRQTIVQMQKYKDIEFSSRFVANYC